jgi:hypothetical protein
MGESFHIDKKLYLQRVISVTFANVLAVAVVFFPQLIVGVIHPFNCNAIPEPDIYIDLFIYAFFVIVSMVSIIQSQVSIALARYRKGIIISMLPHAVLAFGIIRRIYLYYIYC